MIILTLLLLTIGISRAGLVRFAFNTILPRCSASCLSPLADAAEDVVNNFITVDRFQNLCDEYEVASDCIIEECSPLSYGTAEWTLTGLKYACEEERGYFNMFLTCAEGYIATHNITRGCESGCHLQDSLNEYRSFSDVQILYAEGANHLQFLPYLSNVCDSLSCYVKCFRGDLNRYCGSGGSRLSEIVLRPFEDLASQLRASSPEMVFELQQATSSSCSQFFIPEKLNEMRFDSDFISRMQVLLATRMRQELFSNTADEHPELRDLTRPPGTPYTPLPTTWSAGHSVYTVFMVAIIFLNIAALSLVILWCIRGGHVQPSQRAFHPHFHREATRACIEDGSATSATENKRE